MGQGKKTAADVRKTSPRRARRRAVVEVDGGERSGGGGRPHYCELAHTITVEVTPGGSLAVGDRVELALASPPRVLSRGREVGKVDDAKARAMERCLADGYAMAGRVKRISRDGERAEIVVSGVASS